MSGCVIAQAYPYGRDDLRENHNLVWHNSERATDCAAYGDILTLYLDAYLEVWLEHQAPGA